MNNINLSLHSQINQLINQIEQELQRIELWQMSPPALAAFLSQQPFAIDLMESHQWLQWVFLPRMRAILDAKTSIPRNFALYPYFEEALKEKEDIQNLLLLIRQLDELVKE